MKIEITCPECGFNSYRALNTKTNKEVTVTISKCDDGGCNVDVIEDEYFETYETFEDLAFNYSTYKLLEVIEMNCVS